MSGSRQESRDEAGLRWTEMDDGAEKLDAFFRETGFLYEERAPIPRRAARRGGGRGLLAALRLAVLVTALWNAIG